MKFMKEILKEMKEEGFKESIKNLILVIKLSISIRIDKIKTNHIILCPKCMKKRYQIRKFKEGQSRLCKSCRSKKLVEKNFLTTDKIKTRNDRSLLKFDTEEVYYDASHDKDGDLVCCDCGIKYKNFEDLIIEDSLWDIISPSPNKGSGVLCPNCILNRLTRCGFQQKKHFKLVIENDEDESLDELDSQL